MAVIIFLAVLLALALGLVFMIGGARALWLDAKTSTAAAAAFWFYIVSMAFFLSVVLFLAAIE